MLGIRLEGFGRFEWFYDEVWIGMLGFEFRVHENFYGFKLDFNYSSDFINFIDPDYQLIWHSSGLFAF